MIEKTIISYLNDVLSEGVYMERPENEPTSYVLIEKTGSTTADRLTTSTIAVQSYAGSLKGASELNERVKTAMDEITCEDDIASCKLNTDYNFTNTASKHYRYQAVFVITHY